MDGPWAVEPPDLPRVATGIKHRVGRLKAIGNGQVPHCAVLAWRTLYRRKDRIA
jgi:DNA (cytosine-5)-methyltransferase 1